MNFCPVPVSTADDRDRLVCVHTTLVLRICVCSPPLDSEEEHEVSNCSGDCTFRRLPWRKGERQSWKEGRVTLRSGQKKKKVWVTGRGTLILFCLQISGFFPSKPNKNFYILKPAGQNWFAENQCWITHTNILWQWLIHHVQALKSRCYF